MEDHEAITGPGSGGVLDPYSDLVLSLVASIHDTGRSIVDLMGREAAQAADMEPSPTLDGDAAIAVDKMLLAVSEISRTCGLLNQSPFAQEFALPDFALLAQRSAYVKQQFQNIYEGRSSPQCQYTAFMSSICQPSPFLPPPDLTTCSEPLLLSEQGLSALSLQSTIRAGFPSPAEDFQAKRIDVLERLVKHPQATYSMSVRGDSMREAGKPARLWKT